MYKKRALENKIFEYFQPGKAIVIYGSRQVGKSTLLRQIEPKLKGKILKVQGENLKDQQWLSSQSIEILKRNIDGFDYIIIDEAQNINNIGLNLKLIIDHIENVQVIVTGSSSFELANQVGEPLVGRKWQFYLYPFAQLELESDISLVEKKENLKRDLVFGLYPEVYLEKNLAKKRELIESLVDNHLFKDLLALENLKKSDKLVNLLKLIAFQIGHEVSLRELSNALGLNLATIEKYLDLLEKVFVIKRVYGFSRNLRKEVTKTSRFYFFDNGIRNALINNFNDLDTRNDVGQLWENYLFMERLKRNHYKNVFCSIYFWRTYDRKEVDLVEERDGKLFGYEFKWNERKKTKPPKDWLETYDNASYEVITPENYLEFIL